MLKCKGCGVELNEGTVFCPYCGAQVQNEEVKEVEVIDNYSYGENNYYKPKTENKAFKVFAVIGMIIGLVNLGLMLISFATFSVPELSYVAVLSGMEISVPGFVFSCIGKKSTSNRKKANLGFVLNLIAMIVFFILLVVLLFLLESTGTGGYDGGFYF